MPAKPPRKPQKPAKRRGASGPAPEGDRGARAVLRDSTAIPRRNPDPGTQERLDRRTNTETGNEGRRDDSDKLSALHAETLRGIRRCNNRNEPDPLVRGVSEDQAERILSYVRSLAHGPDRLAIALYNAIVRYTEAQHSIALYRTQNREQRKRLGKARAANAKKGRKGSTPHVKHKAVVAAMVAGMKADPPENGRTWSDERKKHFTTGLDLNSLPPKGIAFKKPSDRSRSRWWSEAEATYRAERLRAEAEALDRLAPLMDELCALEPPQPGEVRELDASVETALEAGRKRARRRG